MEPLVIAPTELLLGTSYGLLFGLSIGVLVGSCSFAVTYGSERTIHGVAAGIVAVVLAAAVATTTSVVEPTTGQLPRIVLGGGIVCVLAVYANERATHLASEMPRSRGRPTEYRRTLAAEAIDSVDAMGQVTIRSTGGVREFDGYPPLNATLRNALERGAWRLPVDLPLSELETRLEDRLQTTYELAAVDVTVDSRGRATITAAPPATGIAEDVPDGWRAVSIRATIPAGLTTGDRVSVAANGETIGGAVLSATMKRTGPGDSAGLTDPTVRNGDGHDDRSNPVRNHHSSATRGGDGRVTVAVPSTDAAPLLQADRVRVVATPHGTSDAFDAVTLLERSGNEIRRVTVTESVRERLLDDETAVEAVAVRPADEDANGAGPRHGWEFDVDQPADIDALEDGAAAFVVGPDALAIDDEATATTDTQPDEPTGQRDRPTAEVAD